MFLLYVLAGIVAGYFAGFLGIGAGVMLMPIYGFMGIPYTTAVDASLMAVFISSFTGSLQHYRTGVFHFEPCLIAGASGAVFAVLGNLYLIHLISVEILEIIFIVLMFLNVDLLRLCENESVISAEFSEDHHKRYFFHYVIIGALSGLMASLLGIGGGIIIVTLMILLCKFGIKEAVKSTVAIMTITSFSSLLSEYFNSELPYQIGIPSSAGAVIGGFLGTIALQYVNPGFIKKTNYVISFGLGVSMIIKMVFI